MIDTFTIPLGESKYALQYYNGKVINGKMVFDMRIIKVRL